MSLPLFKIVNSTHQKKERRRRRRNGSPKMMSIMDEELSALEISEDNEGPVQPRQAERATFSLSKALDPYLIPKEVLTTQAVRNTVPVDLTNTQEVSESAPIRLNRLKRKAKNVEFQEQQQPKHETLGGSNLEGQPPYKKPRRVCQEPEHEPGVRDEEALNLCANEFLASMSQATEYMQTLIKNKADAIERMTEAEQHREQATRIIRKEKDLVRDITHQLQTLIKCGSTMCDFVDRNKKDQPYPVCIQAGGGAMSHSQQEGSGDDSDMVSEPPVEPHSVAGHQITAPKQCGTRNRSSQGGMASDVGIAVDSQPFSSEESAGCSEECPPPMNLQFIQRYNRNYARFNGVEMYYEFKFVNLDRVHSFRDALLGMYSAVQRVLDNINNHIEPGDFVQLRLRGPGISKPLYSARKLAGHLNAETFLSAMSNLLQSYAQILADGALTVAVIVITPPRGAGLRHIKSIPYNSIIQKKRLHLIDVPMPNTALCFAASLMAVLDERATATQIKEGAKKKNCTGILGGLSKKKCLLQM
ncbi:uncharacterized protein LOC128347260 isoform X2 [Hemicordylus capensis]|uniref:uncharacterized protein LOC128347260 isoform X2 n=1 Tax=Hemicordylus capensis TaxID=884348 RepID=UPI002304318F|nr:uncharacterized protein LOC128347260 isoform X2 [Hemicordylus capensis]